MIKLRTKFFLMVFPLKVTYPLKLFLDFVPEIEKALWEYPVTNDA